MSFLYKPRTVWFRQVLFQVHLWTGLILGLYILVIGTTGAILVFQDELTPSPVFPVEVHSTSDLSLPEIVNKIRVAYPESRLEAVELPTPIEPNVKAFLKARDGKSFSVCVQPTTGQIARDTQPRWLVLVRDLHVNLLAGDIGYILNGIGASFLLLLCVSGAVIWWPGIKRWKHSLMVSSRGGWKRINWHIHSAVGFWTLALLSVWAVSGIEFVWPKQFQAVVNQVSSVAPAVPPTFVVPPRRKGSRVPLEAILSQAHVASPHTQLFEVHFPNSDKDALVVWMARGAVGDFTHMDFIYFDPSTGRQLALWHRGVNPTLGSKFISYLVPLHFGTLWGMGVKVVWATCGLALPLLFFTGTLMYWNRTLSKKWRAIGKTSTAHATTMKTAPLIHARTDDRGSPDQKVEGVIHAKAYEES